MVEFLETLQSLDGDTKTLVFLLSIMGLVLIGMFFSMVKAFFVEFFKIFRKNDKCKCYKPKDSDKNTIDIKL